MKPLFFKDKILEYNSLLDMKEDVDTRIVDASVGNSRGSLGVDYGVRSTKLKPDIHPNDYPEISTKLLDMVTLYDEKAIKEDFIVWEFNYLIYNEGDHFRRHRDDIRKQNYPRRILSTSTLISQSEDFEGGELIIFNDDEGTEIDTELQVGETVIFHSKYAPHQVNPVTKGTREVLVAWIYYKYDVHKYKNII